MDRRHVLAGLLGGVIGGIGMAWIALSPAAEAQVRVQQYTECYALQVTGFVGDMDDRRAARPGPRQPTPIPAGWTVVGVIEAPGVMLCR